MDFGRAFTFPFADQDWIRKIVITALISLIPIFGWLYLAGWMIEIIRRVLRQDYTPLPEEMDFGKYLIDGLKSLVVSFVYSLPAVIIILPVIIVPFLIGNSSEETAGLAITLTTCCCSGLAILYSLVMAVVTPAALANYAATGELGAAFRLGELFGLIKAAPGAYLMVIAGALVIGVLVSAATIVPLIGTLLAATYGQAVMAHLYAQAFTEARRNRGFAQAY